jgi:hypothetical protein
LDKTFWRAIAINHFELPPGYTRDQLTTELLQKLGEPDPELRDYYIYSTLEHWIQQGEYNQTQLRNMIAHLTRNLTSGIDTSENDEANPTILLRSFSALTLSEIMKYENTHPFLTEDEVQAVLEQAINYLMHEQDLRGYVQGQGWFHALAHAGDLLGALARNRFLHEPELKRIAIAIAEKTTIPNQYVFTTLEEERLALVIVAALTRNLIQPTFWGWWCRQFVEVEERLKWEDIVHFAKQEEINAYHNYKLFLHSIYFQLTLGNYQLTGVPELVQAIKRTLYRLDPGFYSVEVIKIIDPTIDTNKLHGQ